MNYVGKIFSNFKGFYNDINSATLTGAIDVLVIKQADGTFLCSPWHIRFGKMGVIRSKEKIVDIEINGVQVDLNMKLGEAGEAFFVEEIDELQDEITEVNEPRPKISLDSNDVNTSKKQSIANVLIDAFIKPPIDHNLPQHQQKHDTIIKIEGDNVVITESEESLADTTLIATSMPNLDNFSKFINDNSNICEDILLDYKDKTDDTYMINENSLENDRYNLCTPKPIIKLISVSTQTNLHINEEIINVVDNNLNSITNDLNKCQLDTKLSQVDISSLNNNVFDLQTTTNNNNINNDYAFNENYTEEKDLDTESGAVFDFEMSDEENNFGKSINTSKDPSAWANRRLGTVDHPFSDTDITPNISPIGSRPLSPVSDSEIERHCDVMSGSQLVNNPILDDVKWEWGQLPQQENPQNNTTTDKTMEDNSSGGIFQFIRRQKKKRHHAPEQQGIYLEELDQENIKPEIAAMYLYNPKINNSVIENRGNNIKKQNELSQDNITQQAQSNFIQLQNSSADSFTNLFSDIAISLCGAPNDPNADHIKEKFAKFEITYDTFCQDINILSNPNLVFRIGGKFYPSLVASHMIMSKIVFKKYLPDECMNLLLKTHMPKKERKSWWWSRSDYSTTSENNTSSVTTIAYSANQKNVSSKIDMDLMSSSDESEIMLQNLPLKTSEKLFNETKTNTSTNVNECKASSSDYDGSTPKKKIRRSLKLNSEKLASLNLNEGCNKAYFSVTTQYQGTSRCSCSIYLWNWDDRIVVSDIDGTITRSDVWGQVLPMIGKDWSQDGITKLYNMISSNGYKFLYLSARAIGQSRITRDYLNSVCQGNLCLPEGPLLLSPSSLMSAFYKEVIERKPEEFKIFCLRDIGALFPLNRNPLYAGFGNKKNDAYAYRTVGILTSKIFIVNHKGELAMELTQSFQSTYNKLSDIVDHLFPPLLLCHTHNEVVESNRFPLSAEYSHFTYWRANLPNIEDEIKKIKDEKLALIAKNKLEAKTKKNDPSKKSIAHKKYIDKQ